MNNKQLLQIQGVTNARFFAQFTTRYIAVDEEVKIRFSTRRYFRCAEYRVVDSVAPQVPHARSSGCDNMLFTMNVKDKIKNVVPKTGF